MPEDSTKPLGPKLMNLPEGSLCDLTEHRIVSQTYFSGLLMKTTFFSLVSMSNSSLARIKSLSFLYP
jgi:hypothetical protein